MGPFRLMDEIGLDVCLHVAKDLKDRLGFDIPDILTDMVNKGDLGKKTGQGFYRYKNGKSIKTKAKGKPSTSINHVCELTTSMMIEASNVLKEEIIFNKDDIDFAMIMGTGFAPFKGGPLKYKEEKL